MFMSGENSDHRSQESKSVNFETVKISYEKTESILVWLAGLLIEKTWAGKLILLSVIFAFIFCPYSFFPSLIKLFVEGDFFKTRSLTWYFLAFNGIEIFSLGTALYLIFKKAKEETSRETDIKRLRSRTIRGLRAFTDTKEDAEVFATLQRNDVIRKCVLAIADTNFYFGVISGKSGCGKSSLLQAGICFKLETEENHQTIYIRLSNENPFNTISEDVKKKLQITPEELDKNNLNKTLESIGKDNKTTLIILDQFEQFFVHQKSQKERDEFITQISHWYKQQESKSRKPVKILFSVRSDFRQDVDANFQHKMDYALNQYQNFTLDKFTPKEAAKVFQSMAKELNIAFDKGSIEKICREQLAGKEDNLISPVDIQILAEMMIVVSEDKNETVFNEKSFQKVGGVKGLMERFLTQNLDNLSLDKNNSLRQTVVKVLLSLTDLERNTRIGILTEEEIKASISDKRLQAKINKAIEWLEVLRLITPSERNQKKGYELSHELLIPALRRVSKEELVAVSEANLVLAQRTDEWIGNNRNRRYFLSWEELRKIKREESFLEWGANGDNKKELIKKSWRRVRIRSVQFAFSAALSVFLIWTGYGLFNSLQQWRAKTLQEWQQNTPEGRLSLIKSDLEKYNSRTVEEEVSTTYAFIGDKDKVKKDLQGFFDQDRDTLAYIKYLYLKGSISEAVNAIDENKENYRLTPSEATFLFESSKILKQSGDEDKAKKFLDDAVEVIRKDTRDFSDKQSTRRIGDEGDRCLELEKYIEILVESGFRKEANNLLTGLWSLAKRFEYSYSGRKEENYPRYLSRISSLMMKNGSEDEGKAFLKNGIIRLKQLKKYVDQDLIMNQITDYAVETKKYDLVDEIWEISKDTTDPQSEGYKGLRNDFHDLRIYAICMSRLYEATGDKEFLDKAELSISQMNDSLSGNDTTATEKLKTMERRAAGYQFVSQARISLALALQKNGKSDEALGIFDDILENAYGSLSIGYKLGDKARLITKTISKTLVGNKDTIYLEKAKQFAIEHKSDLVRRSFDYSEGVELTKLFAKLGDLKTAYETALAIKNDDYKALALAGILRGWEIYNHPELEKLEDEITEQIPPSHLLW
jgi:ABC-type dipeptide/oligopeptide/nickel transport system ATPase component